MTEEIPARVAQFTAVQNAVKQGDRQKVEIESNHALQQVMGDYVSDHSDLYKNFADDPVFRKFILQVVVQSLYDSAA